MLESVREYNALNGTVTRDELALLEASLQNDEQYHLANKITANLVEFPEEENFKIKTLTQAFEAAPASLLGCLECITDPEDEVTTGLNKPVSPDNIYQMITDKFIDIIKSGKKLDSSNQWGTDEGYMLPYNYETKKRYRGINRALTAEFGILENPYFFTFNQIEKHGGKLKKGSSGYKVVYFTKLYKYEDQNKNLSIGTYNIKKFAAFIAKNRAKISALKHMDIKAFISQNTLPILKYYNVYNGKDITGIDFDLDNFPYEGKVVKEINNDGVLMPNAEAIVKNYPTPRPPITHKGNRAFYRAYPYTVKGENVFMPPVETFKSIQQYYRTLFHELTHSTGNGERLGRDMSGTKGSKPYAKEELTAEMGASFLCAEIGVLFHTANKHAGYLKGWNTVLTYLKDDNRFIFRAASAAQKATDFMLQPDENGVPKYLKGLEKAHKQTKKEEKPNKPPVKPTKKRAKKENVYFTHNSFKKLTEKQLVNKVVKFVKELADGYEALAKNHTALQEKLYNATKSLNESIRDYGKKDAGTKKEQKIVKALEKQFSKLESSLKIQVNEFMKTLNFDYDRSFYLLEIRVTDGRKGFNAELEKFNFIQKKDNPTPEPPKEVKAKPTLPPVKVDTNGQTALFGAAKQPFINYEVVESTDMDLEPVKESIVPVTPVLNAPVLEVPLKVPGREIKKEVKQVTSKSRFKTSFELLNDEKVQNELFTINNPYWSKFLGKVEKKPKQSMVITIDSGEGGGKTHSAFQFAQVMASSGYRPIIWSLEEHKDSNLSKDKQRMYFDENTQKVIVVESEDNDLTYEENYARIKESVSEFDVIIIDSYAKLHELNSKINFDTDFRKKFNGKLFFVIFQRTADGKMGGGAKGAFDGDIILKVDVDRADFRNNFIFNHKNRYNDYMPISELKFSPFHQKLIGLETEPTENQQLPTVQPTLLNYEVVV